jgi:hypothetical protein
MYAFYFLAITDLQDLLPILLTAVSKNKKCWVCFVDSLYKKRQLYYYEPNELKGFIKEVCKNNNLPCPEVDFFGQNDKAAFEHEYQKRNPEYVFLQNVYHKYSLWIPAASKSKVINFAWGPEECMEKSNYNICLNAARYRDDVSVYKQRFPNIDTVYFGNFRLEALKYKPYTTNYSLEDLKNKKVCFIPETTLRLKDPNYEKWVECVDNLIKFLHDQGYFVIWKSREKGHPQVSKNSTLNYCKNKPDLIIDKDLNFPSSLYNIPTVADMCLVINFSASFSDIKKINENSFVIQTPKLSKKRIERMHAIYKKRDVIELDSKEGWDLLKYKINNFSGTTQNIFYETNCAQQLIKHIQKKK